MRFRHRHESKDRSDKAMTLVEVMVAVLVLIVVVVGAVAFLINGRIRVERSVQQRTASQIAAERLERGRAAGYDAVDDDEGEITLDGTSYTWTLVVATDLADPGDSDTDYKQIQVSVNWPTSAGETVVLRTAMSP